MQLTISFRELFQTEGLMTYEPVADGGPSFYKSGEDFDGSYFREYQSVHRLLRRRLVFHLEGPWKPGAIEVATAAEVEVVEIPSTGFQAHVETRYAYDLSKPLQIEVPGQTGDCRFCLGVGDLYVAEQASILDLRAAEEGNVVLEYAYGFGIFGTTVVQDEIRMLRGERLGFGPLGVMRETVGGLTLFVQAPDGNVDDPEGIPVPTPTEG